MSVKAGIRRPIFYLNVRRQTLCKEDVYACVGMRTFSETIPEIIEGRIFPNWYHALERVHS